MSAQNKVTTYHVGTLQESLASYSRDRLQYDPTPAYERFERRQRFEEAQRRQLEAKARQEAAKKPRRKEAPRA